METRGCTTTVRQLDWPYDERPEDVADEVLRGAEPAWRVSITCSPSRTTWMLVAQPEGHPAFSAVLTPGLGHPALLRTILKQFYSESLSSS